MTTEKQGNKEANPTTREGRIALARMTARLFDLWGLSPQDQLSLMGLSGRSLKTLERYRKGFPLPDRKDLLDRVAILLSIHKSLRVLLPHNKEIRYKWISIPNRAFHDRRPIEVIRDTGLQGLLAVKRHLDNEILR